MVDYYKKLSWGRWLIKTVMAVGMMVLLFSYGAEKSVTANEFVVALAKVSALVVVMWEVADKLLDKSDYIRMYGWMYRALGGKGQGSWIQSILAPVIVSAIIFFGTLALVTGTLTTSIGAYSPAMVLVGGIFAVYAMLPETGDDELILWIWLAAQIYTKFQYFTILPGILDQMVLGKAIAVLLAML